MLKKILKFGITGGLGTVTNLILFFIFADLLKVNPRIVSVCCFILCASQNYCLNHIWTFKVENQGQPLSVKLWLKFLSASLLGFLVNFAVLNLLLHFFEWEYTVVPQGVGILAGMAFNFLLSNFFVFKSARKDESDNVKQ